MLPALKAYTRRLSETLARCFPRTTAYLREEHPLAAPLEPPGPAPRKASGPAGPSASGKPKPPAKPRKPAVQGLYGPAPLVIEDAQVEAMRQRVAEAAAAGLVSPPSDEQWAMILGRSAATRIFAGAGSGKSTTLLLRVVFMLCHMGIAAERLTVISFTNASCAELREQLLALLAFWRYPFDEGRARHCVRTFHSAMATLAREALGDPRWFEQLDEPRASATEPDNPLAAARLRPAQQRLLAQVYQACYAVDGGFRERVHRLLELPAPVEVSGRATPKAPLEGFKLSGEFAAVPLFEAFQAQAGFMESIGLRVDEVEPTRLACPPRERLFVEALQPFWRAFEARLREDGLMTFNGAFRQLTERLGDPDATVATPALTPFTHLLIDEFQDISPQILLWLQALHRRLARQGQAVSLMAIGDDWQSIYGWRGSSPELFMDFDKHFPGKGKGAAKKSAVLTLETNYRSIDAVIRDGEAVLEDVAFKQAKASRAFKSAQPGDHGVRVIGGFDLNSGLPDLIAEIERQCAHVAGRAKADRTAVLLLSRRNGPLKTIKAQLERKLPVKAYSIHRAKGLQAEVAIVLDDCLPPEPHPLRNALYARSGFFRSDYDRAMQDESLRLAYVAITRGVSRVLWYTRKVQGATQVLAAAGRAAG
ncbi:UvrD-helicase domain-containing protein [Pseudomonas sp. RIT-PI-AD]|uniref:UvrD-helicase domain-containing protein n=1 Tax=Pseudomonas sp. RIT-PI-AD TaxID=3035294 RepID=UPI0021DA38D9|nr:UvrD-helicase domain-containing protein [Pseudomonas sp. RIT-PI-AD]